MGDVYRARDNELERVGRAEAAAPALRRGPGVRRALQARGLGGAAAASTPTSSRSSTAASGTAPTTSRWSTSPGRTLKQIVREHGPLDPPHATEVVEQILEAARFAHERGIVHRDIKPHNVIVDEDGRVEGDRLRHRAGRGVGHDRDGLDHGHGAVPVARAGPGPPGRRALGSLLDRHRALRAAHRRRAVRRRVAGDDRAQAGQRGAGAARPAATRPCRRRSTPSSCARMQKDPAARFQSADEFLAALEQARLGVPAALAARSRVVEEDGLAPGDDRRARACSPWPPSRLGAWLLLRADKETVPDVVGKTSASAAQVLQNRGFEVDVVPIRSDSVPDGRVAGQRPEPGEEAKKGSTVSITVSSGPGECDDPRGQGHGGRRGGEPDRATPASRPSSAEQYSGSVDSGPGDRDRSPRGHGGAEGQHRHAGRVTRAAVGQRCPNVVGRDRDDAESAAAQRRASRSTRRSRRTTTPTRAPSSARIPAAGAEAAKGSTVKIVVAKAPPQVEVPDVTGLTGGRGARQRSRTPACSVRTRTDTVSAQDQDGVVLSQQPEGRRQRRRGRDGDARHRPVRGDPDTDADADAHAAA